MTMETLTPVLEPEVEVSAKARRRTFTAEYKRRILQEADACTKPGEVGALLRREGLYFSHLRDWGAARERGEIEGLSPKKRGRKARPVDPRERKIAEQERELARLKARLERAEALLELQKKVAQILGSRPLENDERP